MVSDFGTVERAKLLSALQSAFTRFSNIKSRRWQLSMPRDLGTEDSGLSTRFVRFPISGVQV